MVQLKNYTNHLYIVLINNGTIDLYIVLLINGTIDESIYYWRITPIFYI